MGGSRRETRAVRAQLLSCCGDLLPAAGVRWQRLRADSPEAALDVLVAQGVGPDRRLAACMWPASGRGRARLGWATLHHGVVPGRHSDLPSAAPAIRVRTLGRTAAALTLAERTADQVLLAAGLQSGELRVALLWIPDGTLDLYVSVLWSQSHAARACVAEGRSHRHAT